jgi:hypothetical protein
MFMSYLTDRRRQRDVLQLLASVLGMSDAERARCGVPDPHAQPRSRWAFWRGSGGPGLASLADQWVEFLVRNATDASGEGAASPDLKP